MTTAQVLFEQYKVLPERVKQQYRKLILTEERRQAEASPVVDDQDEDEGDTIRISPEALRVSIEQVKLLRAGKAELSTLKELFAESQADE